MAARQVSSTREVALPQCLPAGERRSGSAAVRGRKAARARSSGWGNSKRPAPKAERRPAPATRRRFSAPGLDAGGKLEATQPGSERRGQDRSRRRSEGQGYAALRGRRRPTFRRPVPSRADPERIHPLAAEPAAKWGMAFARRTGRSPLFPLLRKLREVRTCPGGPTQSAASAAINTNSLKLSIRL